MNQWLRKQDIVLERYCQDDYVHQAREMLMRDEQSEEGFLGAQGVLLLCGLL